MKRLLLVSSFVLLNILFLVLLSTPIQAAAPGQSSQEALVKGNTEFAVQSYRQLSAKAGNLFFSPYSISSALGMTYAGARANTAKEMAKTLHFDMRQTELPPAFKSLNQELTDNAQKNGQKLNIANALVLTGGGVRDEFMAILKDNYNAEIFPGNLTMINDWVKQKTEGKIPTILEELSPDSICVLLNAIYFKGIWSIQFEKNNTHDASFKLSATKQTKTSLMHQKSDFKLFEKIDFKAISLPYKGQNLSMVILLPQAVDGLAALEKQLTAINLNEWLGKLHNERVQQVDLYLPKFKLETSYDLVDTFNKLGMKDAFTSAADFTGMRPYLLISQIKHKAFVEVNEEGTEAAAATAVEMTTKSMHYDPEFRADHPFIFIIRDNQSGTIVFMGRMVNPQ